jgi:hypothetical protein
MRRAETPKGIPENGTLLWIKRMKGLTAEAETRAVCPAAKTGTHVGSKRISPATADARGPALRWNFRIGAMLAAAFSTLGENRVSTRRWGIWWMIALTAACVGACRGETQDRRTAEGVLLTEPAYPDGEEGYPTGAMPDLVEQLRESLATTPHPSDGGGRAWLEQKPGDPDYAIAGTPGRFTLIYEVGPEGIAVGGMIYFQVSPFWDWSTPQVEEPDLDGYTVLTVSDEEIQLDAATLDQQLLGLRVSGRALRAGDRRPVSPARPTSRHSSKCRTTWKIVSNHRVSPGPPRKRRVPVRRQNCAHECNGVARTRTSGIRGIRRIRSREEDLRSDCRGARNRTDLREIRYRARRR